MVLVAHQVKIVSLLILSSVLVRFMFFCDKAPQSKITWGVKGLFDLLIAYQYHYPSLKEARAGTKVRNLEARTVAEEVDEHCLMACSSWPAQSAFLHRVGPRDSTTHNGQDPLPSISSHNKCITGSSPGRSYETFLSIEVLYSQLNLACVKLTES